MITWMQRHRKYLNITLWISVGAFIAAGPMFAIGSGSFSGRSADSVAKVGEIEISMHQMNTAYRQLFSQYNQMFQGKFDESQAKAFGLEQQALRQLVNESLLLNLAKELELKISDKELGENITKTDAFFKDGSFDKETYEKVLKQAQLKKQQYENDVRRSLLLGKLMGIISPTALPIEGEALSTALYINDKISYKVLDASMIKVTVTDEELKNYWQSHKMQYLTEPSYTVEVIEQAVVTGTYSDEELKIAYAENKHNYTDKDGVIKSFEDAKTELIATLDAEATSKEALRTYISYKKEKLDPSTPKKEFTITASKNPFGSQAFAKIMTLQTDNPFLKPIQVNGKFMIFKLLGTKGSEPKSFEAASDMIKKDYIKEQTSLQLVALAKSSTETFSGTTSDFITRESINKLKPLSEIEAAEFLEALFEQQQKLGYVILKDEKIVLFNILEQKLLKKGNDEQDKNALQLKMSLLNNGLLKKLGAQYPVTSYLKGN